MFKDDRVIIFRLAAARASLQKELEYVQKAQNSHYALEEVSNSYQTFFKAFNCKEMKGFK